MQELLQLKGARPSLEGGPSRPTGSPDPAQVRTLGCWLLAAAHLCAALHRCPAWMAEPFSCCARPKMMAQASCTMHHGMTPAVQGMSTNDTMDLLRKVLLMRQQGNEENGRQGAAAAAAAASATPEQTSDAAAPVRPPGGAHGCAGWPACKAPVDCENTMGSDRDQRQALSQAGNDDAE